MSKKINNFIKEEMEKLNPSIPKQTQQIERKEQPIGRYS